MITASLQQPQTIAFLLAGGPGSGCRGTRCGRPRGVKSTFQSPAGFTYTLLQPSRKNMSKGQHTLRKDPFRGKYRQSRDPLSNTPIRHKSKWRYSNVYDAKWGRGDKWEGHGTTLFVHRDFRNRRMVVEEVTHDELNHTDKMRVWKFKNFGTAAGFLNKRYGIKQALPKVGDINIKSAAANPWSQISNFKPEEIEDFFEKIFSDYGQGFKPLHVDKQAREVLIELKDGRQVKEKI